MWQWLLYGTTTGTFFGLVVGRIVATAGDSPIPLWGQLGIAALFIGAFLTMQIVPGPIYKKMERQYLEERALNQKYQENWETKVLPTMQEWTSILRDIREDSRRGSYNRRKES